MSHTTTVRSVRIGSTQALQMAVEALQQQGKKVSLVENAVPRMYYNNQHGKCDYVLKLGGQYDVGLELQADGSYVPVFDEWGGHVANVLGTKHKVAGANSAEIAIGGLMQEYAKATTRIFAENQGYSVEDVIVNEQTGEMQVLLVQY